MASFLPVRWLLSAYFVSVWIDPASAQNKLVPGMNERKSSAFMFSVGSRVKLQCRSPGAPKPLTVSWYKDEEILNTSQVPRLERLSYALVIRKSHFNDSGLYACLSRTAIGESWQNFTLIITGDEEEDNEDDSNDAFEQEPINSTRISNEIAEGPPRWVDPDSMRDFIPSPALRNAVLKCPAQGHPQPEIKWLKDGVSFDSEINLNGHALRRKGDRLIIERAVLRDSGNYTCVVSNIHGTISFTMTLFITQHYPHRPLILEPPRNQSVKIGRTARFTCRFFSGPTPKFQWLKYIEAANGSSTNPRDQRKYEILSLTEAENATIDELVLTNVTMASAGLYICVVGNTIGHDYAGAWLRVYEEEEESESEGLTDNDTSILTWVGCFLIVLLAVALIVVAVTSLMRRYCSSTFSSSSSLLSKRILIMRDNVLYHNRSKDPEVSVDGEFLSPLVPRFGGVSYRQRMLSETTILSEYEIPLDNEWELPRDNLKFGKVLGEGAFGVVLMATMNVVDRERNGEVPVAVKTTRQDSGEREFSDLIHEMEVMKSIGRHTNIINLIGCCTQRGPLYVVVEYAPYGSLRDFLRERRPPSMVYSAQPLTAAAAGTDRASGGLQFGSSPSKPLSFTNLVSFGYQIARGMEYLSSKMCIHRDLAARNVLVGEDFVMKIADFGLSRNIYNADYYKKTTDGRLPVKWMAPEALFDRKYTAKSDVWSFGVLLWEVFTLGGTPYPSVPVEKLFGLLREGHRMEKPPHSSLEIYDMMLDCWHQSPHQRPSFMDLVLDLDRILAICVSEDYLDLAPASCGSGSFPTSIDSQYASMVTEDSQKTGSCNSVIESPV